MATVESELDYLVLDAGAIIRGHGLNLFKSCKKVVTVPEVIAEIRDSKARELFSSLPYEIEERAPSIEAFKAVIDHAKKTGDFAALSKTDLKLIALAYMLEIEIYGSVEKSAAGIQSDIRKPIQKVTSAVTKIESSGNSEQFFSGAGQIPVETHSVEQPDAESGEVGSEDDEESDEDEAVSIPAVAGEDCEVNAIDSGVASLALKVNEQQVETTDQLSTEVATIDSAQSEPKKVFSWANVVSKKSSAPVPVFVRPVKVEIHAKREQPADIVQQDTTISDTAPSATTTATVSQKPLQSQSNIITRQSGLGSTVAESQRLAVEDDGVGWINTSNLTAHMSFAGGQLGVRSTDNATPSSAAGKKKAAKKAKRRPVRVACVTTDFSMQNVLMQIGLNVMSVDGLLIRSVKQWVLRCMACFQVHYDMDRLFCVKCGANHLSRVSASIDAETGVLKLHLRKNYQNDTRGTKYSLPAPGKQDRYSGELLLREDQLLSGIWRQKCVKIRKDIKSVFGEDVTADVGLHINKSQAIKVGLGQRNPNATKGRERRGKAKK